LRGPVESGQYVSLGCGQAAGKAGIARSMSSRGDCYANAVAESFFATLKKELVHRHTWPTRRELTSAVFDYVEAFYNPAPATLLGGFGETVDETVARVGRQGLEA